MASITIRNLDDDIKHLLRVRAAEHGRSMEEEARDILRRVMGEIAPPAQSCGGDPRPHRVFRRRRY
jgi:plasmid stability protein